MKMNHANFYFQKCVYQTGRSSHESVSREAALSLMQEFGDFCLKP